MSMHSRRSRLALAGGIAATLALGTLAGPAMASGDDASSSLHMRKSGGDSTQYLSMRKAGGTKPDAAADGGATASIIAI